jgi:hypothetical protein
MFIVTASLVQESRGFLFFTIGRFILESHPSRSRTFSLSQFAARLNTFRRPTLWSVRSCKARITFPVSVWQAIRWRELGQPTGEELQREMANPIARRTIHRAQQEDGCEPAQVFACPCRLCGAGLAFFAASLRLLRCPS